MRKDFAGVTAGDRETAGKRVLVAGLVHQTNTFAAGRTGLEDFRVSRGEGMLAPAVDRWTAEVLRVGRESGWEVVPVLDARALPGPTVADAVVDLFWAELRAVAEREESAGGVHGVFLLLHGSTVSESLLDVEGEILRRLRGIEYLSKVPICGVLDARANLTDAMRRQSDGFVAYREDGAVGRDMDRAARDAARLLDGLMDTEDRPTVLREHPPHLWPPSATAGDAGPIAAIEGRAEEIEDGLPGVVAVNVFGGFPYADVPDAGVCFSAVANGDPEPARAGLKELAIMASLWREEGPGDGTMALEEAMLRLQGHDEGPVLIVEPSDSVWAGAPGDGTGVLRAFVDYGIGDAGVVINDPEAVGVLENAEPGDRAEVEIGGKGGEDEVEPLLLEVEVFSKGGGRFAPEHNLGLPFVGPDGTAGMGPCSVVKHAGVKVLLTSRRTPPFDLGQWRSVGVQPEELFAVGVKASFEHRRAYGPIARASYTVDLPGPASEDLARLPYENVDRPVSPLDLM